MPKLARRLAAPPPLVSKPQLGPPSSPPPSPPSAKYSKQPRPSSLVETREPPPLSLALPFHRPGGLALAPSPAPGPPTRRKPILFLAPSSIDLAHSTEVDTSLPLESQEWYHGILSRVEAEGVLRTHSEGSYLVRATADTGRTEYSLAIKSSRGFMHLRIQREASGSSFRVAEFDRKFPSVVAMVHHYSINRLPIRGAEHMCLLTPVTEELL